MSNKILDIESALVLCEKKPFYLAYRISGIDIGKQKEAYVLPEDLLEAHFFDVDEEIRIFKENGVLKAAVVVKKGIDHIEQVHFIENPTYGSKLKVCKDLEVDEDGQIYISAVRLTGWEE